MSSAVKFDAEKVIPGLKERREQERANRALAFAGITHTVCGREVLPLTPGHRIKLQLLGNGFAVNGKDVDLSDVFVFLWVLSPHNRPGIEGARQQHFLKEDVMGLDLRACVVEIVAYLKDQLQDSTENTGGEGRDMSAWIHWAAAEASFWASQFGWTEEKVINTPYLVIQQLFRAWKVNNPDCERMKDGSVIVRDPVFFNSSDRLIQDFRRQNADRIKAWHLSQKTKRN